ncbi:MAG: UDP-N-acetylmuramate--L-alanine ligase [Paludibacteraceae bacterium]|nr:UDP-N-acetylmuramate--L-alanine ligase [Paludibacteraceae bacterium]
MKPRFIISGGGTGGHIFPAVSIAGALKQMVPDSEILFVGAEGRMEMEKVPAAGYKIVGLPIQGLYRSLTLKNLKVLHNAFKSIRLSKKIITDFNPDAVIGVGGYASGPVLWQAQNMGIPTLLQEQNSYAGVTNKLLSKRCQRICVAYDGMERFFPADKIILTGNPVRSNLLVNDENQKELGYQEFNLDPNKKTLLVIGGSLGARTINHSILAGLKEITTTYKNKVQVIWQTGKIYIEKIREQTKGYDLSNVIITDFVSRMDLAYAIADLVISRSGASSISELCLLGKPCILVPSPNVAEDHQTKNALALSNEDAAVLITDKDAPEQLTKEALKLINSKYRLETLHKNILKLAKPNATRDIALQVLDLIGYKGEIVQEPQPQKVTKKERKNYYFLGIGGIGMSALARWFNKMGHRVAGYDLTKTQLTEALEAEGINIHYKDSVSLIPVKFMDPEKTTIIYTPAIPNDMGEFKFFRSGKFTIYKRSEVLGVLTEDKDSLCVAGSHGKTTTSTMIAHILHSSGAGVSAFLGGISKNFNSNLVVDTKSNTVVAEADEYDRSFLRLKPYMAVVTATDADHLDIYGTKEEMLKAYSQFTHLIREDGVLLYKKGIELTPDTVEGVKCHTYSMTDESADYHAANIQVEDGTIKFDFIGPDVKIENVTLGVPVMVNVENAVAAMAIAHLNGVTDDKIRSAVASFQGTKRRFDIRVKNSKVIYIDDYAHHPEEISATLGSIKRLYPGKKICCAFQPHLYSRTRDFAAEFAESLSAADHVILLDIYPAREKPLPGVTSEIIYKKLKRGHKTLCKKEQLTEAIKNIEYDILVTMGAGNIDAYTDTIAEYLK